MYSFWKSSIVDAYRTIKTHCKKSNLLSVGLHNNQSFIKDKLLKDLGYPVLSAQQLIDVFRTSSITVIPQSDVYRLVMRPSSNIATALRI